MSGPQSAREAVGEQAGRAAVATVQDLRIHYRTPRGDVIAVNGVSFQVYRGEIVGVVGESGCGKTTMAMGLLRAVPAPGQIVGGRVSIQGTEVLSLSEREFQPLRWKILALVPQAAMNALNPLMRVKDQIIDVIVQHEGPQPGDQLKERVLDLLADVGHRRASTTRTRTN